MVGIIVSRAKVPIRLLKKAKRRRDRNCYNQNYTRGDTPFDDNNDDNNDDNEYGSYSGTGEKINAVDGNDALLKSYNVIVGSFRQRLNAQSLCERLRADGYPAVLAQNAQGMYRVVACSFDDRATAVQAREGLQAKYPQFTDAWFLINK